MVWTYSYDALGNLRQLASNRTPANLADNRTWSYADPVRPRYLSSFAQQGQPTQTMPATATGEPSLIDRGAGNQEPLLWNAQGKLYRYKDSTYSWDALDKNTLVVTGVGASQTSIVRVGDDFEYDLVAGRATKYFSVDGVRIAGLATLYSAPSASLPPALYPVVRTLEPLGAPAVALLFVAGLASLGAVATRRRTPAWLAAPGVGMLGLVLAALPYSAVAATLPGGGPGTFGRPAEPFLAYLTDHLGSVRAVVNASGAVVETRDYDPFGGDIAHTGTFSVQHRFTGQPADDQAGGFYNYGARFYNAKWGRFVSPDDLVQGFDSQGLNPYAYVLNCPTSLRDPSGTFAGVHAPYGTAIALLGGWNPTYTTPSNPSDPNYDKEVRTEVANLPLAGIVADVALGAATLGPAVTPADLGDLSRLAMTPVVPAIPTVVGPGLAAEVGAAVVAGVAAVAGGALVLCTLACAVSTSPNQGNVDQASGDKSPEELERHQKELKGARARLKDLEGQLGKAKGPKRQRPIREAIEKAKDAIKGHVKEIKQKWGEGSLPR